MHIPDKVFLVTGAASGLGAATARALLAAGGKVLLVDRDAAVATRAAELGSNARGLVAGVRPTGARTGAHDQRTRLCPRGERPRSRQH